MVIGGTKMKKRGLPVAMVLLLVFGLLSGCGPNDKSSNIKVTVAPEEVTLPPNGETDFTATVTGASDTTVTWSATGGQITATGHYTAPLAPDVYYVTATSKEDSKAYGRAKVTVSGSTTPPTGRKRYEGTIWLKNTYNSTDQTMSYVSVTKNLDEATIDLILYEKIDTENLYQIITYFSPAQASIKVEHEHYFNDGLLSSKTSTSPRALPEDIRASLSIDNDTDTYSLFASAEVDCKVWEKDEGTHNEKAGPTGSAKNISLPADPSRLTGTLTTYPQDDMEWTITWDLTAKF